MLLCWHILRLHVIFPVLHSLFLEDTTPPGASISTIVLATVVPGTVLLLVVIGVYLHEMRQGQEAVDHLAKSEERNFRLNSCSSSSHLSMTSVEVSVDDCQMTSISEV